ncbi:aminoglycoside phosphotransferase family protein [Streptomyces aquilus]|uniref:Aminoglycoside phosphotransferase family protein n=1 Tax=Streptomyces aquilus TaxID=2548456 RepID=A0A3S9I757_9ACTN|nr:phosphotransferase [Streptomyces aquilus]AZP20190.1 aminoglycoside phosphotransferase family protein [Streptomyces aquilus]
MTASRRPLTRADLAPLARAAVGGNRTLVDATRLRGGSKKGVYRLAFDDGFSAIAYVWSPDEDYWDAGPSDLRDPFSHGTGLGLFAAAHDRLAAAGVRTPRLLHVDAEARQAVVEDLPGGSLEAALPRDPALLDRLAALLDILHTHTGPRFGKVALVDGGGTSYGTSCEQRVLEGALRDIAEVAGREPRAAAVRERLVERAGELAARVRPRERHTLIHGELGPDHVLLTQDGELALIDIEGLLYFDVEWEHVFLEIRFGDAYEALRVPDLDEDRLRLYRLAMRLSLVAGPLRLLDGDFPFTEFMRGIAEHNLVHVLDLVRR